jgi:putative colanic acid biosysnthesis UDP-glucose lipid carrier transferase
MKKDLATGHSLPSYTSLHKHKDVINVRIKTIKSGYSSQRQGLPEITSQFIPASDIFAQPLNDHFNCLVKRSFDILFSLLILFFLLSWLTPLLAILILIDSKGPVFFLQKRNKKNGEIFTCIKFRTMIVNTGADLLPAVENDKRITKLGQFLRTHFLDELPQFLNVLLGDMSVIGPRPHMISDNLLFEGMVEHYAQRHAIKPGITGLAQALNFDGIANNRNAIQGRLDMGIFYIRHWSFKMDMLILYRTTLKIFIR